LSRRWILTRSSYADLTESNIGTADGKTIPLRVQSTGRKKGNCERWPWDHCHLEHTDSPTNSRSGTRESFL